MKGEYMAYVIRVDDIKPGDQLIDVRTPTEFAAGHIAGALNLPLETVESRVNDIDATGRVVLVCKAGTRAQMAARILAPCRPMAAVLEGGMDAWFRAARPVVVSSRTRWSLERQVRLIAGLMVLAGVAGSLAVHPYWIFLAAFAGLGLTFAGLTDLCPMGLLLSRMPWNRRSKLVANRESTGDACLLRD
jgi:rhodanese-related sulfurtransferase